MLVKEAHLFGKVGLKNGKMPGTTFAVDSFACITGGKLRNVEGSVCSKCYSIKLQQMRPSVDVGYKRNLAKWMACQRLGKGGIEMWISSMVFQILRANVDEHRWFDGGDAQSVEMIEAIAEVARRTPDVKHWFPTKEYTIYTEYLKTNTEPDNLTIRVSAAMIDGKPSKAFHNTSTVHKNSEPTGFECDAYTRLSPISGRPGYCGPCRACWDKDVPNVSYPKH